MRVDQFVPSFVKHDAISNHVLQIRRVLRRAGYQSDIWFQELDRRMAGEGRPFQECDPAPDPDRLLLYHASTHSPMADWLVAAAGRGQAVALDYHNITPSRYFSRWEPTAARSMDTARHQLASLVEVCRFGLADSEYNRSELVDLGMHDTAVVPILLDLDEYHGEPDRRTLGRLGRPGEGVGRGARWLFVGRVAPNKCQHDVVASFAIYRRLFDPDARLAVVGGVTSPRYLRAMQEMADSLDLGSAVDFVDSAPFAELLAYFRAADVFVCLSEHEGFCVPLIEAMELGLPVVAYRAAAVTDTVSSAGVLLDDKDPLVVAAAVHAVVGDEAERGRLVAAGHRRAATFSLARSSDTLVAELARWVPGGN